MVGNISSGVSIGSYSTNNSSNTSSSNSLQSTVSSILSNYDSENLTQADAKEIVESFKEEGIEPSQELAKAMEVAGFDAKEVGSLAGVGQHGGKMPPPPPPPREEEISSISSLLDTLLSKEEDEETTSTSSEISDYSNKIANLNEETKLDVVNLLEKFSANNSNYSNDEMNSLVKNSLNQILGDSENYNQRTFYG